MVTIGLVISEVDPVWTYLGIVAAFLGGGAALAWSYGKRRRKHYQELGCRRQKLITGKEPRLHLAAPEAADVQSFGKRFLARIDSFLDPRSLEALRAEAMAIAHAKKRSFVPSHKKGGTVSYEQIHESCPACLAFYHGEPVKQFVSNLVGEKVGAAGDHDQSAESNLYYDEAGDHIQWHFDHNFYEGRQFAALINVVNRSADGTLSASKFQYRGVDGAEIEVDTSENTFVVFEGAKVLHRATPTHPGDLRVMLSMTFNTAPKIRPLRELKRRFKDTAFFGLKVLWN